MVDVHYKHFLALAAGQLASSKFETTTIVASPAATVVLRSLSPFNSGRILYQGSYVEPTSASQARLGLECERSRGIAHKVNNLWMAPALEMGERWLSSNSHLVSLIAPQSLIKVKKSVFVYYEKKGDRSDPHFDDSTLPITAVVCLRHRHLLKPSLLRFLCETGIREIQLRESQCLVFEGASMLHARQALKDEETVHLLVVGMEIKRYDESGI